MTLSVMSALSFSILPVPPSRIQKPILFVKTEMFLDVVRCLLGANSPVAETCWCCGDVFRLSGESLFGPCLEATVHHGREVRQWE